MKRPGVVPTSEVPMVMLSWVKHGRNSDFGDRLGYPERPGNSGALMRQEEAVERFDADCDAYEPAHIMRQSHKERPTPHLNRARSAYWPLWNGICDPDPRDVRSFRHFPH